MKALNVTIVLLMAFPIAYSQTYQIDWYVIGSGGGHSESGAYAIDGTIGQPIVGVSSSASYRIESGFWVGAGAPSGYEYLPGDANMDGKNTGNDVTYLVNFFRSAPTSVPCYFDNGTGLLWASADANGSCDITGNDVTKMVNFNRSDPTAPALLYCDQYEPLYHTIGEVPNPLPEGWPFCDNPVVTGTKIIPTSSTK